MTDELKKILSGEEVMQLTVVDYSTPENMKTLQNLLEQRKKIQKRKEVNWNELNQFRITI